MKKQSSAAASSPPSDRRDATSAPGATDGATQPVIRIDPADVAQFRNAEKRSLEKHLDYSFIRTYRPVLDDGNGRSFSTMAEYRAWCNKTLPKWLGYGSD